MLPYIHICNSNISTYYLTMFIGFLAMVVLMIHRRAAYRLNAVKAFLFALFVMVAGLIGCKLLFVLENIPEVLEDGLSFGGFSFYGAVFVVPVQISLLGRTLRLDPIKSINASAPCVCAMVGTIRIGCFLNGCCGGWITSHGFRWPTQALESVGDFVILLYLLERESKDGHLLYPRFMLSYGTLRFFVEFLRDTPKDWLGLSHGQWFSILSVMVGGIFLLCRRTLRRPSAR